MTGSEPEVQEVQAQEHPHAPGARILKVTSILLIVYGSLAFVALVEPVFSGWGYFFLFLARQVFEAFVIDTFIFGASFFFNMAIPLLAALLLTSLFVILPVLQICIGMIGKRNCHNIEKAGRLRNVGKVTLAVTILYCITLWGHLGWTLFFMMITVISLATPIAYMYGAQKNLKAWKEKLAM